MNFTGWFQHENFETDELGELSEAQALQAINDIDWPKQCELFEKALNNSGIDDACQPGIGINSELDDLFHLYLTEPDEWELLLDIKNTSKFLGIFPKPDRTSIFSLESLDSIPKLLSLYYAGEVDQLFEEYHAQFGL